MWIQAAVEKKNTTKMQTSAVSQFMLFIFVFCSFERVLCLSVMFLPVPNDYLIQCYAMWQQKEASHLSWCSFHSNKKNWESFGTWRNHIPLSIHFHVDLKTIFSRNFSWNLSLESLTCNLLLYIQKLFASSLIRFRYAYQKWNSINENSQLFHMQFYVNVHFEWQHPFLYTKIRNIHSQIINLKE